MIVEVDTEHGATYAELSTREVVRTVHVGDLVMVDIDDDGQPIGVDFAVAPTDITDDMLIRLVKLFPELDERFPKSREWLFHGCSV